MGCSEEDESLEVHDAELAAVLAQKFGQFRAARHPAGDVLAGKFVVEEVNLAVGDDKEDDGGDDADSHAF